MIREWSLRALFPAAYAWLEAPVDVTRAGITVLALAWFALGLVFGRAKWRRL